MKRIQSAVLHQVVHFQLKDGVPHEAAVQEVQQEYQQYKENLERSRTKYRITDENIQPDGSIIIRVRKQYLDYETGSYI